MKNAERLDLQVNAELDKVRNTFLTEFDQHKPAIIDVDYIEDYFTSKDLYYHPVVTVPDTPAKLALAHSIAKDSLYPMPFVYQTFSPDNDYSDPSRAGTAISVPAYRLNFQQDNSELMSSLWGEVFTKKIMNNLYAHELAHGIFHAAPELSIIADEGEIAKINEYYPLSGLHITKYDSAKDAEVTLPMWIEEAFAVYLAAQASADSMEGPGHVRSFDAFGKGEVVYDEAYVMRTPDYPDQPGLASAAIAGQTLEELDRKLPGTIEDMFAVARNPQHGNAFRSKLQAQLPDTLYDAMFSHRSYEEWHSIYSQVIEL